MTYLIGLFWALQEPVNTCQEFRTLPSTMAGIQEVSAVLSPTGEVKQLIRIKTDLLPQPSLKSERNLALWERGRGTAPPRSGGTGSRQFLIELSMCRCIQKLYYGLSRALALAGDWPCKPLGITKATGFQTPNVHLTNDHLGHFHRF